MDGMQWPGGAKRSRQDSYAGQEFYAAGVTNTLGASGGQQINSVASPYDAMGYSTGGSPAGGHMGHVGGGPGGYPPPNGGVTYGGMGPPQQPGYLLPPGQAPGMGQHQVMGYQPNPQPQGPQILMMSGGPHQSGAPLGVMHSSGAFEPSFPAVKLRGLPFSVQEDEIRQFVASEPVDVLMVSRGGRFSGEAFVLLAGTPQLDFALQRNRTNMGKRYVEVFKAKRLDYYKAVAQFMSGAESSEGGLHSHRSHHHSDRDSGRDHKSLRHSSRHRHSSKDKDNDAEELRVDANAVLSPDGKTAGLDGLASVPIVDNECNIVMPRTAAGEAQQAGTSGGGAVTAGMEGTTEQPWVMPPTAAAAAAAGHTGVVKLRGLPYAATKADVVSWFSEVPITSLNPDAVHVVIGYDGRPTGMAFAEFASAQDAMTAMCRHRQMFGARYVELFPSSRQEATQTATGSY